MAVAIRAITRVQDADDAPALGAGQQGYALTWNNATGAFVATALVTDHGALSGLTPDDDHTQYALLAGRAGGQTLYGGTAANDDITIHGTSDSTRTTSYVILQPTAGYVGIGTSAPASALDVNGTITVNTGMLFTQASSGEANVIYTGSTVKNSTSNNTFGFMVAGLASALNNAMGPYFGARGNTYSALANQRGNVFFSAGYPSTPTTGEGQIRFICGSPEAVAVAIDKSTFVGIGTTAPATLLHAVSTTATTDAVRNILTLGSNVTSPGVGAAGLGAAVLFTAKSTTTVDTTLARVQALWYEATHATFKGDLVLTAYDAGGEREGLRIRGAGSAPAIGFYGVAPIERAVLATGAGATVDNVITALQNLGLVKQS